MNWEKLRVYFIYFWGFVTISMVLFLGLHFIFNLFFS